VASFMQDSEPSLNLVQFTKEKNNKIKDEDGKGSVCGKLSRSGEREKESHPEGGSERKNAQEK